LEEFLGEVLGGRVLIEEGIWVEGFGVGKFFLGGKCFWWWYGKR
jgi:hypothetical protein